MHVGGENGAIQVECLYKVARKDDFAGSTRVAMHTGSSTLRFLLGDHLGSTATTTDINGAKIAEIRYYPWGTASLRSGDYGFAINNQGRIRRSNIKTGQM